MLSRRGGREAQAYLLDGAAARVGNCECHPAGRYPTLTQGAPVPVENDKVPDRIVQGLEVAPAHAGLHVIWQTKQV